MAKSAVHAQTHQTRAHKYYDLNFTGKIVFVLSTSTLHFSSRSCRLHFIHIFSPCSLIKNNNNDLGTWIYCFNLHPPLSLAVTVWININGLVTLLNDASVRCLLQKVRSIPFSPPFPFLHLLPGVWLGDWGSSRRFES